MAPHRPRIALGLEASRPDLDASVCTELGRLLADARRARGLSVKDVAASLLLAPVQVTALEDVHPEVFYGADFYAAALRKYVVLVGLDSDLVNRALVRPDARVAAAAPIKRGRRSVELSMAAIPRPSKRVMSAVALVVTGVAGWLLVSAVRHRAVAPEAVAIVEQPDVVVAPPIQIPPQSSPPVAEAPRPQAAVPAPAPVAEQTVADAASTTPHESLPVRARARADQMPTDETVGHVSVAKRTWIFVRYGDNSTVQRGLAPGERFVLQDVPTYLAVGSAADTAVVIGGRTIDNAPFTTNGQLRVGSSQLARLSTQRQ